MTKSSTQELPKQPLTQPVSTWEATGDRIVDLFGEMLTMPCVTGYENLIADWTAERYASRGDMVMRIGNSVVVTPGQMSEDDDRPLVLLVGHLDVVPPTTDDLVPYVTEAIVDDLGNRITSDNQTSQLQPIIVGRGASDMKAGNTVIMDVFEDEACRKGPYRLALVLYAGEEGPAEGNELPSVLRQAPGLLEAVLAVVAEPTDGEVQLGCMGGIHVLVEIPGKQAHSARPWQGENALTKAGAWLATWHDNPFTNEVTIDGLTWREAMSCTQSYTGNARNVIPGVFTVNINYRFAPDKTLAEAMTVFDDEITTRYAQVGYDPAELTITSIDEVIPAYPHRTDPYVVQFIEHVNAPVTPKQAWTDVAYLASQGVPALNFSPGLGNQAHQRGEFTTLIPVKQAREQLYSFLTTQ